MLQFTGYVLLITSKCYHKIFTQNNTTEIFILQTEMNVICEH